MDKFSLILHPRDLRDYIRMFPAARYLPEIILNRVNRYLPPLVLAEIKGVYSAVSQVEGELRCCPLTSRQLRELSPAEAGAKINKAVEQAGKNGAKLVGLGGLTATIGEREAAIGQDTEVAVTRGNYYRIYAALLGILEATRLLEIDLRKANVVILGATGVSGSICARFLAKECRYITLVAWSKNRLEKLALQILYENGLAVKIMGNIKAALREADLVIMDSTALNLPLKVEDLKPGSVVYRLNRPADLLPQALSPRKDILVIDEEIIAVPGKPEFNYDFGFPAGKCPAWMAEVMILTLEKRFAVSSEDGEISLKQVKEIGSLAQKHGFKLAGLRSNGQSITRREIERVKEFASSCKSQENTI